MAIRLQEREHHEPCRTQSARPVTAVMFFVSLVVIGLLAAFRLPLEQFPDVNVPFVFVSIPYPGSTPQEVERQITRPVEEALSTLPGIKMMNSQSQSDSSGVFLMFSDWDRDISITASEARDRIDAIRSELPDDLQRYFVQKFSPNDEPLMRIRFASDRDLKGEYHVNRTSHSEASGTNSRRSACRYYRRAAAGSGDRHRSDALGSS